MFTPKDIKDRLKQQPFEPFRIVTSSGESYEVEHPDLLWVGANVLWVGIPSKKDPSLFDGASRVALMHVTALENVPAKAAKPAKSDGQKK